MQQPQQIETKAQIINFNRRRGRPKNNRPARDTGTPEMLIKRAMGLTTESLDLCLQRGVINERQHWCGIHLRWLYTLRNGAPTPKTTDFEYSDHGNIKTDDPQWKEEREREYGAAINLLTKSGHSLMLLNICVYNERPRFLNMSKEEMARNSESIAANISRLRDGLDILSTLWKTR